MVYEVSTRFIFYEQTICLEVRVDFRPKLEALSGQVIVKEGLSFGGELFWPERFWRANFEIPRVILHINARLQISLK